MLGECCTTGRDFPLNLLVFILVSGTVLLSEVGLTFNVLYLIVFNLYLCIDLIRLSLLSASSCTMRCCCLWDVLSRVAVNSLSDMVSVCRTSLLMLMFTFVYLGVEFVI